MKNFLKNLEDYDGVRLNVFQGIEQKPKSAFLVQTFHPFESFVTLRSYSWNFTSIDASDISATLGIISRRKSSQKVFQKSSSKFQNTCIIIRC